MPNQPKRGFRFSLSTNIGIGLCLGIIAGLFLGEYCAPLQLIGNAFIKLLQMSILPYLVASIIAGIGSLTYAQAKSLARKAGVLLLLFWAIGFCIIVAEFGKLQVYFVVFFLGIILLTFLILPLMVSAMTPFKYKDVFGFTKDALITGFTTGSLFVILPVLSQNCKDLFEQYKLEHSEINPAVDIVMPASFNFPNIGKLLMLLFILFAGWFYGNPVSLEQYPSFIFSGLFSLFASVTVAIPFMLDLMRIPSDAFQLYLVTGVINGRLATLCASMHLVAFTLIATCSITGFITVQWRKLFIYTIVSVLLTLGLTLGSRAYLTYSLQNLAQTKNMGLDEMRLKTEPQPATVRKTTLQEPINPAEPELSRLENIKQRGLIRIGYHKNNLPFSFFNRDGELVGFDIDMAHALARDLGLRIEFIPFDFETLDQQVKDDQFDIAMSGIFIVRSYLRQVAFSNSYMRANWAFVVKDHLRHQFESLKDIKSKDGLTIGFAGEKSAEFEIERIFPLAKAVQLDSVSDFFETDWENVDCLLISAEAGSAWTLMYPQYQVVAPEPLPGTQLLGYPITGGDQELLNYVNSWIDIIIASKYRDELYSHWILGKGAEEKKPRWSVIRDVLKWVE